MFVYKFPFGPLATNALLIGCSETKKSAVIDPSFGSSSAILSKATDNDLKIEKILLTHSHWDHFADAHELIDKTNVPLYVHVLDAKNVERPGSDGIPLFSPVKPILSAYFLHAGDRIEVGHLRLEVIHSPGHSPGSVCFYLQKQNLLIAGDTLFQGSIGNLNLPTANPLHMWESLKKLARLPPETRVIPGHGGETSIGKESWLSQAQEIFSK